MKLRIFRQPTKDMQPNGEFYIDTIQYQTVFISEHVSSTGTSGITSHTRELSDWIDVTIVEADSY